MVKTSDQVFMLIVHVFTGVLLQPGDFWCAAFRRRKPGRLVEVHGGNR